MNAEDVFTIVRNCHCGEPVSVLVDGIRRFDIAVRLSETTRSGIEALRRIPLHSIIVARGVVSVDGVPELRKTCKIRSGQKVTVGRDIRIDVLGK